VLVTSQKDYAKQSRGYMVLRKLLGNGLVTSEGSFWLRQRRIAQPAFHRDRIIGFADVMRTATREMLHAWQPRIESGSAFDVHDEMMKLTLRIVGETLLSADVTGAARDVGDALTELLHQAITRTRSVFWVPDAWPTPANRRFHHARGVLDDVVLGIIHARRTSGEDKPDLLSMLMNAVDEETGERMDDVQLRDEVMTLFLAGHETTSNALTWTLWQLANLPEIESKLRAEIDDVTHGAEPSVEHVMRMPYLDAVLKESMRLYPPVWIVTRSASVDDVIGGYRIGKGDFVFLSPWVTHRHPKLWPNPTTFDPTRFLVDDDTRPKYAYFPFIGGPRKCIGDFFATLEMKLLLTMILQRVRLTLVPDHVVVPEPVITLRPKDGVLVTAQATTPLTSSPRV
jgi:cytochrome P450